jgi:hypothetical protein
MPIDILIVATLAGLLQVAGLMMLLRGAIWLFGPRARTHFVYGIFSVGSTPFNRIARASVPRAVPDAYIPAIAFVLVCALWVGVALAQQSLCLQRGVRCG